ncbi:MAG TPA: metallophosphoesterase [Chryseosolibacter sp.]
MTNRRRFIQQVGAGAALTLLSTSAADAQPKPSSKRVLRIAHITDVHILDQPEAERLFGQIIREINTAKDKVDFIINTGDTVMDENKQTKETVEKRWNSWRKIMDGNRLAVYSALGNHDVWYGPDEASDTEYKKDPRYGKQWAMEELKMPARHYTFQQKNWKFIALDSINGESGYQLDGPQLEWLGKELSSTPTGVHVCVFNHVPILSMGALLYYTKRKPIADVKFPSGDMHNDHQAIKDVFHKSGNVRLCLSGHVHYVDAVDYLGVRYLCNGAVSGNWWGKPLTLDEFPPVYTLIDLFEDGSTQHQYVYYKTEA